MATKRTSRKQDPAAESSERFDPRILIPAAGAALAAIAPAVALGGRAIAERREQEARAARAPFAVLGVAAVATGVGVLAWRFRHRVLAALDASVAGVIGAVERLRAMGEQDAWDDDADASAAAAELAASAAPGAPDAPAAPAPFATDDGHSPAFDGTADMDRAGLETYETAPAGTRS